MAVRLRDLARPLAALVALNVALMLAWTVVLPTFRGADEHVHHDLLRYLTETWAYPDYDEVHVSQRTLILERDSPVHRAHRPPASADLAEPRDERTSWVDAGPDVRDGPINQIVQHPPLYYLSTAAVLRVIDGDGTAPVDRVVLQLRLLSVATLAALPVIAADIARRLSPSRAVVLSAAAGVLAVPQLTHLGGTVSNDPLMILWGSLTVAGVTRMLTGDRRWSTAAFTGVAAGLALLTKGFAVPLVPAVALACVLPAWWSRRSEDRIRTEDGAGRAGASSFDTGVGDDWASSGEVDSGGTAGAGTFDTGLDYRSAHGATVVGPGSARAEVGSDSARAALVRGVLVGGLAAVVGGWWWVRNVVVHGNVQPGVGLRPRVEGIEPDVVDFAGNFAGRLIDSFWGNVGWREAQLPFMLSVALTIALVVAVAVACWADRRRLVLVVPTLVAGGMVLAAGWGAYKKTGVSYATQGRYLFASITVLVALGAIGMARLGGAWVRRHQPLLVLSAALALQAAMLVIAVRRYWAGPGLDRIDALAAFSPLPSPSTVALLLLPVAAGPAAWIVLFHGAWRTAKTFTASAPS